MEKIYCTKFLVLGTLHTLDSLFHNTDYEIKLASRNPVGVGQFSDSRSIKTNPVSGAVPSTTPSFTALCILLLGMLLSASWVFFLPCESSLLSRRPNYRNLCGALPHTQPLTTEQHTKTSAIQSPDLFIIPGITQMIFFSLLVSVNVKSLMQLFVLIFQIIITYGVFLFIRVLCCVF